ncbi:TetR/AcrR family transcriptional regulator [Lactiplantibacillus plantarum]|uniref:Fatty acid metabolism regulator protein n=1 Tax=Lactiplantibacillus plantarum TaxID=1590 RepID=A0A1E3KMY9_LACPN|nr:TetR/AcrR family transcriptional regulator [Lactiplantibacillus plantarum]ODO60129.1 Fatty acid metabolism regulator protein [Lactiplantibacillus plantarum]
MREKDLDKEKSIIDEVSRIILKEGIADVSMSKIAKASGISSSTIYVYFSDKEDLLKQVYLAKKRQLAAFLSQNINTKPITQLSLSNSLCMRYTISACNITKH